LNCSNCSFSFILHTNRTTNCTRYR